MSERQHNAGLIDMDARDEPGVYVIANLAAGKLYIGSSYKLRNRLTTHIWHLRNGKHGNRWLQSAWNRYGEEAFFFAPLEYAAIERLEEIEQRHIDEHRAASYNLREVASSNRGYKYSDEARARMSELSRKFTQTSEYRARVSALHKGREKSAEERANISAAKRGIPLSEEAKQKLREAVRAPMPKRTAEHNTKIAATKTRPGIATAPDGTEHPFTNLREFCRERGLDQSHMGKVARGQKTDHKGWKCRY
jgi:group I intron endonuclease